MVMKKPIKLLSNEIIALMMCRKKYAKSIVNQFNLDIIKEKDVFELVKLIEHNQGKCQLSFESLFGSGLSNNSIYYHVSTPLIQAGNLRMRLKSFLGRNRTFRSMQKGTTLLITLELNEINFEQSIESKHASAC